MVIRIKDTMTENPYQQKNAYQQLCKTSKKLYDLVDIDFKHF